MAAITKPVFPLEIWAEADLVLPNSGRQNKVRPIDDLWQKGWDKGQKPDCEAFNYLLNLYGRWIQYSIDRLDAPNTDYLEIAQNLADVLDKAAARRNLDVYSKAEAANAFVNVEGDTMTGPLSLGRINFTGSHSTDFFYVECSYETDGASEEFSHLDFVFGDNATQDQIRFRCKNTASNGAIFNVMTIESKDGSTGRVNIYNELHVSSSINTGTLSATTGNFTNTNVSGTGSFGTIRCHSTTINSGGTTTNYARVNGDCNVNQLIVNNNWAVVAGRHIVRTVNGAGADANGAVWISTGAVQDIRLTGNTWYWPGSNLVSWNWQAPAGAVMTGIYPQETGKNSADNVGGVYYAYIQKLVNGAWYNVGRA